MERFVVGHPTTDFKSCIGPEMYPDLVLNPVGFGPYRYLDCTAVMRQKVSRPRID